MLTLIRHMLTGPADDFTFRRYDQRVQPVLKKGTGLYIHIPFCTHFCPYCPYLKLRYSKAMALEYKEALIREIGLYHDLFGRAGFSSLYIGGGTPTLMLDELGEVLEHLHRCFNINGDLAIETNPNDVDRGVVTQLRSLGFNLVSLGIQSFDDRYLRQIGRDYDASVAVKALETVGAGDFDTVNVDLIFVIDHQTVDDVINDLAIAVDHRTDQVTCYPLFTFPYSEVGRLKQLNRLRLPDRHLRKKMYYAMNDFMAEHGYTRTNVWSFHRDHNPVFSSVTRDYFLGLGAGAGTYNGSRFCFNTFSVPHYIQSCRRSLPIAVSMTVSRRLEKLFWLYWRLYETSIPKTAYRDMFGEALERDFGNLLRAMRMLRFMAEEDDDTIKLNTRGAHWIHLLQNHYALNYVGKLWRILKADPFPEMIVL
jgi:coproporphyrinogen III oxidase-like Fe-S oxidoreductase